MARIESYFSPRSVCLKEFSLDKAPKLFLFPTWYTLRNHSPVHPFLNSRTKALMRTSGYAPTACDLSPTQSSDRKHTCWTFNTPILKLRPPSMFLEHLDAHDSPYTSLSLGKHCPWTNPQSLSDNPGSIAKSTRSKYSFPGDQTPPLETRSADLHPI